MTILLLVLCFAVQKASHVYCLVVSMLAKAWEISLFFFLSLDALKVNKISYYFSFSLKGLRLLRTFFSPFPKKTTRSNNSIKGNGVKLMQIGSYGHRKFRVRHLAHRKPDGPFQRPPKTRRMKFKYLVCEVENVQYDTWHDTTHVRPKSCRLPHSQFWVRFLLALQLKTKAWFTTAVSKP